jgi:putative methionine-R-sulfoxide reductase with GAF domain
VSARIHIPRFRNHDLPAREQRCRARRSVVDLQLVTVNFGPENGGIVLDICDEGIGIQTVRRAETGTAARLNFILPRTQARIDVNAEIVWSDGGGRLGMRFLGLEETLKNKICEGFGCEVTEPGVDNYRNSSTATLHTFSKPAIDILAGDHGVADASGQSEMVDSYQGLPRPKHKQLEAVVNDELLRMANSALLQTSADGAAIALRDHDEMVGIASVGTAPDVGARFRLDSGLSGECVRTGNVVRCQDTDTDARVNPKICRELNLRSLVIAPIRIAQETIGVLEVLSSRTWAFEESDVSKLSEMAASVSSIMLRNRNLLPKLDDRSAQVQSPRGVCTAGSAAKSSHHGSEAEIRPRDLDNLQKKDFERNSQLPVVIADAPQLKVSKSKSLIPLGVLLLLMGVLFYGLSSQHAYLFKSSPAGPISSADIPAADARTGDEEMSLVPSNIQPNKIVKGTRDRSARLAIRLRLKSQNNKQERELARSAVSESGADGATNPPNNSLKTVSNGMQTTPSKLSANAPEPTGLSGGAPIVKVTPLFPSSMLVDSVERVLVLKAIINGDGSVKGAELVSGPEALALPAIEAVKKWKYEPFTLNGKPVAAQTFITIKIAPQK